MYSDGPELLQGEVLHADGAEFSPSSKTKQDGLLGGYLHTLPLRLHLAHSGVSLPHLRLAFAQAWQALVSRIESMVVSAVILTYWKEKLLA